MSQSEVDSRSQNNPEQSVTKCEAPAGIQYDDKRRSIFLKELALTSNVRRSAAAASLALSTIYYWRDTDPRFAKAWQKALATGYETLEIEMLERARSGVEKPIYHAGEIVATVRHYNDAIALRLLLAHKDMVAKIRAEQSGIHEDAGDIRARVESKLRQMQKHIAKRRARDGE